MGVITIGLCMAVNGYTMLMLQLEEVDRTTLRRNQAASSDWHDTNKLLTNTNIRALRSTGRSYAISTNRSIVIDHILPPCASATSTKKVPGPTNCSMYGAITIGTGKYGKTAKNRIRALIFYSDRKIAHLIATKKNPDPTPTPEVVASTLVQRVRKSQLINMVPDTIPTLIKLATYDWSYYKAKGYKLYGASDGSGEKNDGQSGAYAWVIVAAKSPTDMHLLHRGWG